MADMYYEVWVDEKRIDEARKILNEVCSEVHEVYYDYQFIVRAVEEDLLKIDGIKRFREHYKC